MGKDLVGGQRCQDIVRLRGLESVRDGGVDCRAIFFLLQCILKHPFTAGHKGWKGFHVVDSHLVSAVRTANFDRDLHITIQNYASLLI